MPWMIRWWQWWKSTLCLQLKQLRPVVVMLWKGLCKGYYRSPRCVSSPYLASFHLHFSHTSYLPNSNMLDLSLWDRVYQLQQTRRFCVNVFHASCSPFHLHFFNAPYVPTGYMLSLHIRAESTRRSRHVCKPLFVHSLISPSLLLRAISTPLGLCWTSNLWA